MTTYTNLIKPGPMTYEKVVQAFLPVSACFGPSFWSIVLFIYAVTLNHLLFSSSHNNVKNEGDQINYWDKKLSCIHVIP